MSAGKGEAPIIGRPPTKPARQAADEPAEADVEPVRQLMVGADWHGATSGQGAGPAGAGVLPQPPAVADRARATCGWTARRASVASRRLRAGQRLQVELVPTDESRAFPPCPWRWTSCSKTTN